MVQPIPEWLIGLGTLLLAQALGVWRNEALNRQSVAHFGLVLRNLEERVSAEIAAVNDRLSHQDACVDKIRERIDQHANLTDRAIQRVRDMAMELRGYRAGVREGTRGSTGPYEEGEE